MSFWQRTSSLDMGIISNILNIIIAICLMLMVYTQYNFVKSSWCEYEIDKVLFTLEDIAEELDVR